MNMRVVETWNGAAAFQVDDLRLFADPVAYLGIRSDGYDALAETSNPFRFRLTSIPGPNLAVDQNQSCGGLSKQRTDGGEVEAEDLHDFPS